MDPLFRKFTLKFRFKFGSPRPRIYDFDYWLHEGLGLREGEVLGIGYDFLSNEYCVKLRNDEVCQRVMRNTKGSAEYTVEGVVVCAVTICYNGLGLKNIRIYNLPFEMDEKSIRDSLAEFGTVYTVAAEQWRNNRFFNVDNGVRVVRIDLTRHVPSFITVRGFKALVTYEGQPRTCSLCNSAEHLRAGCPRRRPARPTSSEITAAGEAGAGPVTYAAVASGSLGQQTNTAPAPAGQPAMFTPEAGAHERSRAAEDAPDVVMHELAAPPETDGTGAVPGDVRDASQPETHAQSPPVTVGEQQDHVQPPPVTIEEQQDQDMSDLAEPNGSTGFEEGDTITSEQQEEPQDSMPETFTGLEPAAPAESSAADLRETVSPAESLRGDDADATGMDSSTDSALDFDMSDAQEDTISVATAPSRTEVTRPDPDGMDAAIDELADTCVAQGLPEEEAIRALIEYTNLHVRGRNRQVEELARKLKTKMRQLRTAPPMDVDQRPAQTSGKRKADDVLPRNVRPSRQASSTDASVASSADPGGRPRDTSAGHREWAGEKEMQ